MRKTTDDVTFDLMWAQGKLADAALVCVGIVITGHLVFQVSRRKLLIFVAPDPQWMRRMQYQGKHWKR